VAEAITLRWESLDIQRKKGTHPGYFAWRVWICLIAKELIFSETNPSGLWARDSPQQYVMKGVRDFSDAKIRVADLPLHTSVTRAVVWRYAFGSLFSDVEVDLCGLHIQGVAEEIFSGRER